MFGAVALATTSLFAGVATAQDFPGGRPVEVLVGFGAGGGTDLTFRTVGKYIEKQFGVPVVIVNKPGAGGAVAWTELSQANKDGHIIGSVNLPAISGAYATGALPVDPREVFTFLSNVVFDPTAIAVKADSKFTSLGDLVDYLKANDAGVSYAATGSVSTDGLTALALQSSAGVRMRLVNFAGGNEAVTAVLGGHVDSVGLTLSEAMPFLKDGSIRLLAIGGSERNAEAPDVPTFAEQGYPLTVNGSSRGFVMPAGADPALVEQLREVIRLAATDPDYIAEAARIGQSGVYETPEFAAETVNAQLEWLATALPK
jgi:tripartite-type tricarboxylate transporter receptor subunit TctC